MKIGIIIETKEPEKSWNALRFANACLKQRHEARVFLMGEAVECQNIVHEKYDAAGQLKTFGQDSGVIYGYGNCMKSRGIEPNELVPM